MLSLYNGSSSSVSYNSSTTTENTAPTHPKKRDTRTYVRERTGQDETTNGNLQQSLLGTQAALHPSEDYPSQHTPIKSSAILAVDTSHGRL